MTVYNRVVFNRGTGLGNRLFPWSRCVISSAETNTPMLAPRWTWPIRKGAIFAGGIDRRAYMRQGLLIGVFQPRPNEITGLAKLRAIASGNINDFIGEEDQFRGLIGRHELIRSAFRESTKPHWRKLADEWRGPVIGINVRRGKDFQIATSPEDFINKGAIQTPLDWFVSMLRELRRFTGKPLPAVVVSDGTEDDLKPILNEPDVRMLRPGCPASDLLVLSETKLLLGSGGSSFSAWASYLGHVPVLTIPGQSLSWFGLDQAVPYVGTCDPNHLSDDVVRLARSL